MIARTRFRHVADLSETSDDIRTLRDNGRNVGRLLWKSGGRGEIEGDKGGQREVERSVDRATP